MGFYTNKHHRDYSHSQKTELVHKLWFYDRYINKLINVGYVNQLLHLGSHPEIVVITHHPEKVGSLRDVDPKLVMML